MKRYVLGFFLTPDGVILIEKSKPEWQRGKWNGLGGSIEAGESAVNAMVREFGEESAIITRPTEWKELFVLSGGKEGGKVEPWEMTVFTMFAQLHSDLYLPYIGSEGFVTLKDHVPSNTDSTAAWLIPMCIDLYRHEMKLACSNN